MEAPQSTVRHLQPAELHALNTRQRLFAEARALVERVERLRLFRRRIRDG